MFLNDRTLHRSKVDNEMYRLAIIWTIIKWTIIRSWTTSAANNHMNMMLKKKSASA